MTIQRRAFGQFLQPLGVVIAALALGLGAAAGHDSTATITEVSLRAGRVTSSSAGSRVRYQVLWQRIDELIAADQFEAASQVVAEILASAAEEGDSEHWTRALVRSVQLRIGLHGYETAVRFLRQQPWPETPRDRAVLNLFYSQSLKTYLQIYSWEIGQRERVETSDELDLKRWTREQILGETERAYLAVWVERQSWGEEGIGALAEFLEQNTYPARIRGTLRDAVTYLWVEMLGDTANWSPVHSNQTYRLDLAALLGEEPLALAAEELDDQQIHPLRKICAVLEDLEHWHRQGNRPEAAFEARLERARRLHASFDREEDRRAIREHLRERIDALGQRHEWWSMGQATLAELAREEPRPEAQIRAREIALAGEAVHPESLGGRRCRHLVAQIEAPEYSLTAMTSDGVERRSILVRHRNIGSLHLRAYAVDLLRQIASSQDYSLLPDYRQVPQLLAAAVPEVEWSVSLPATPDFRLHQTFLTPPIEKPGLYLIVASARRDFAEPQNRRAAVSLLVGDLVLVSRPQASDLEVTVRSGASGRALPGIEVHLYRYDYRRGHHRLSSRTTDAAGQVRFARLARGQGQVFLVAQRGRQFALEQHAPHGYAAAEPGEQTSALVYTDRSVYRPLQRVLWKVVAYRGVGSEGRFRTLPSTLMSVELVDPNQQVVESRQVRSNLFGSASGEFEIPSGRLLGAWSVRTSLGGQSAVRVEEYKRPTFEVQLLDPAEPLRLNRPARLLGEGRYYFGLPVVTGTVSWRVERVPVLPRWWSWHWPLAHGEPQIVAAGEAVLDATGRFEVAFEPEADERQAGLPGLSYSYRLSVDLTDEGGETRSAERVFRLGFVAVEASIEPESAFFRSGEVSRINLRRRDLDGNPRAGEAWWRLLRLRQPGEALLPAEQPLPPRPGSEKDPYDTPGDTQRPRWSPGYEPQEVLRQWPDGEEVLQGETAHDEEGSAEIAFEALPLGAYRLRYATRDDFGALFETASEFVVAADGQIELALPALLLVERARVEVGETARLLVHSALEDQELVLELYRRGERLERRVLEASAGGHVLEIPIEEQHRGGFGVRLTALRDHQLMTFTDSVFVPWRDRELGVRFSTFRDLLRPGSREAWRVEVSGLDGRRLGRGTAELLAYMYDRSLDLFAPHQPANPLALYPITTATGQLQASLGSGWEIWSHQSGFPSLPEYPSLVGDRLKFFDGYGIGGLGRGRYAREMAVASAVPMLEQAMSVADAPEEAKMARSDEAPARIPEPDSQHPLRADFSETAFWQPHLLLEDDGTVGFEFTVPDSVTEWSVWVHALTGDLKAGSLQQRSRSVKELMVRPYLPRFLREGDRAELKIVVNNASSNQLRGELEFEIVDPMTDESLLAEFGLDTAQTSAVPFTVAAGGGSTLVFPVLSPSRVGEVAVRVRASAGGWSDGEARPLPLLPGRMHLVQSRFAALRDRDHRVLEFQDLAAGDDPTMVHEQMVVTLDAQLFYGALHALPYLVSYPYECTEQTLNRFLSTGIVSSLYEAYPGVARMAEEFSRRETRLETWDAADPNRKLALEETPWLLASRGGKEGIDELINVLDPRIARAERQAALAKLEKAQTSLGGFPWWPGGPPSPYMSLYLLQGFSRALEFGIEVPKPLVTRAWGYMHRHYVDEMVHWMMEDDCCWETVTFLNYVLSSYPDESWTGGVFGSEDTDQMLEFSWRHWRRHSPLLKSYLALTLHRAGRTEEARQVFDSVMDSSRTTPDEGTFWAPEDRAWLWYNDTVETHAMALRTLIELDPDDERRHGLVQWLFLNKKLNHWKSTRATAEAIYSLVHYLEREGVLAVREEATVRVGPRVETFVFDPAVYTGKGNRLVVAGSEIDPATSSTIVVEKETPGLMFASATWHFSTERLPAEERGDLFQVSRRFFKRLSTADGWTLAPLTDGAAITVGDQLEVQLSVTSRHAAEYVHLRDPRGAGYEPVTLSSGFKWDLGIGWYEEVRDSGTNFFFEWLPAGEYTLRYRLRAAVAGTFKAAPAVLQSMYAPEFAAYSSGATLEIRE